MIGTCVDPALLHWGWERITTLALLILVLAPAAVVVVLEIRSCVRAWRRSRAEIRRIVRTVLDDEDREGRSS